MATRDVHRVDVRAADPHVIARGVDADRSVVDVAVQEAVVPAVE